MEEKIEVKELSGKRSGLLTRYNTTFSINRDLTEEAKKKLQEKIENILLRDYYSGSDKKIKFELSVVSAKEYYIGQLNKIIVIWWAGDYEYPDYIDKEDTDFLDSLFPRFVEHQGIYFPGTVVIIDTMDNINNSKTEIKNEIISICKQF